MAKPLVFVPPVLFAGIAAMFFAGMYREDPNALPSAFVGKPAPAVTLDPLGSLEPFDADMLAAPGYKLVNFWASWCAPCRVEHPNLQALADEGIPIYGVNYKDDADNALEFLEELGNPYEGVGTDDAGRVSIEWGVYGVPETFLIDGEGKVVLRFAGPVLQRTIEERLRPAMAGE